MSRQVDPEKLDSLPHEAPDAVRSRRDLQRINALMGNHAWVTGILGTRLPGQVVEIGAGDGQLANALVEFGWKVTAVDLAPKPSTCASEVDWLRGDLREVLEDLEGDVLLGCLLWHHFQDEQLISFRKLIGRFHGFLATEPWRVPHARLLGAALCPFVNGVTRHDMFVSIRAGFQRGELGALFDLSPSQWEIQEAVTLLGAYRLQAWKRQH
jgi:SAM-dependent methyltransferase